MILAQLAALSLAVAVSTGPIHTPDPANPSLTPQQKNAAVQTLIRSATECITRSVNERRGDRAIEAIGDLIVESMPACAGPVQAMIDGYDLYFGQGSGEAFFMGPYLDVLPKAVLSAAPPPAR